MTPLRAMRMNNNYTISSTANALAINPVTYRFYESGKRRPPLKVLRNLAKLYGTTIDALVGDEDDPVTPTTDAAK